MAYIRIREIRERQQPHTIQVRVLRKWISKGKKEELCYQFVDAYGDAIEAAAKVKDIEHFDSLIQLQLCYNVSNYVCTGARTYMSTIDHVASLVIGQKATFEQVQNVEIPSVYFNFATYETIKTRIKEHKLLTDYIGRVKKNSMLSTSTGKQLRKTLIHDDMGREVEITLWPEKNHLIRDNVIPGDIVAITSTFVTEHNGRLQLESTYLTTVEINPDMPQTIVHVTRLREAPAVQPNETRDKTVTLLDLKLSSQQKIQTNFICEAKITQIYEDRGWYYVLCSKCSDKMFPQQETDRLIFVCTDHDNVTPNFRYCVNATITDKTGIADAVFFNDSMQEMLNMTCMEMFTKHADTTNPKIVPQQLKSAVGKLRRLHLTLNSDGKIVVNNVSNITPASATQTAVGTSTFTPTTSASSTQTAVGTSTFTPTTPLLKVGASKRPLPETPGTNKKLKR